jgi:hypothetical protein
MMRALMALMMLTVLVACAAPDRCPDGPDGGMGGTGLCPTDLLAADSTLPPDDSRAAEGVAP